MNERICLFCKHFFLEAGTPAYSDWTPGTEAAAGCRLDVWSLYGSKLTDIAYRECIEKGRTCGWYEFVTLEELRRK